MKTVIRGVDPARSRTLRKVAHGKHHLLRTQSVFARLSQQGPDVTERLSAVAQSHVVREANQQLVLAALDAHAAADLAEQSRRDAEASSERRTHTDRRAKDALSAMNASLEERVVERTRELASARDDALAAVRAKEQFLSNMSHELRTPMNGMLGALELLAKSKMKPKQTHYLGVATASGEALLGILNEVLDFAKISSNVPHMHCVPIDVSAIARSVVALYSALAERTAIDLQLHADPELSEMRLGDALHLRQVLLNLVGNAMKFTPKGSVSLRTRLIRAEEVDRVAFEVKDTGIGIDASQLQRIFEPFVQAADPSHRRPGGTGLGLSISRQLVAAMGGELKVRSVPGQGSSFSFDLALGLAPVTAAIPLDEAEPASETQRLKGRVLIVEDNLVNQMIGIAMLESLGLTVVSAENGEEALLKMVEESFDLVLMDCHMPIMDGYEATRRIRAAESRDARTRMPVVALTANAFKSDVDRCMLAGMDAHLAKPYSTKQLRAALAPWLPVGPARLPRRRWG